jgi:hypothetical protein
MVSAPPVADEPAIVKAPVIVTDVAAELPEAEAEAAPQEFPGRLPGVEEAARIASEIAAAKSTNKPDA